MADKSPMGFELIREVKTLGADFSVEKLEDGWSCKIVNGSVLPLELVDKIKRKRDDIILSLTIPYRIVILKRDHPEAGIVEVLKECKEWDYQDYWPLFREKFPNRILALEYLGRSGWCRCLWSMNHDA